MLVTLKIKLDKFLDLFYKIISPPYCHYCYNFLGNYNIFCHDCDSKITPTTSVKLQVTPHLSVPVYAICEYKYPVKKLILAKMFAHKWASKYLAQLIFEKTIIKDLDFDFIIPVPLHWSRFASRGFNQADVMAHELARLSSKSVVNIISRTKKTVFQSLLSNYDRSNNLKNAFEIKKKRFLFFENDLTIFENKKILIVDDLMTTGATLASLCKVVQKLRPSQIIVVVACRTV